MNPSKDEEKREKESSLNRASHFLEEVNEKGERGISGFGKLEAFNAKVKYGYSIKTSPELKDFPPHSKRGFRSRKKTRR